MRYFRITAAAILLACLSSSGYAAVSGQKQSQLPKPPAHPVSSGPHGDSSLLSGKVVETMNAGGYTYVCLEKNGKKTWAAAPEMKVSVGQELSLMPGQEMGNFTSKTLNRTFDKIVFSPGLAAGAGGADQAKQPQAAPHGSKGAAVASSETISVTKAGGPDAHTVSELYAKGSKLHNKNVTVRGQVVKVSAGIMDRNWIHLQDGTGDRKKGTHNLVVTSDDIPAVGDVVIVSGTLARNKDFGAGYSYKVIIEKAKIIH